MTELVLPGTRSVCQTCELPIRFWGDRWGHIDIARAFATHALHGAFPKES